MRYRSLSLAVLLLALAARAEATTTYYVAIGQAGADNAACDGLTPTDTGGGHCPFKDLTSAAVRAKVTSGNDVRLEFRTGTYDVGATAFVVQGAGGSWNQATVVTSYRGESVTFTGTYTSRETVRLSGTYVEVSHVTIIRAAAYNVEHRGSSHTRLRFNTISDNFDSDLVKVDGGATDADISSNEMTQWVSQAIDIAGATGTVVEGNYMHGPKVAGQPCVGAKFNAVDIVVRNNVGVGCAVGVSMGGASSSHAETYEALRMVVEANSFSSLTGVAFVLYSCIDCVLRNNHVWSGVGGVRLSGLASYVQVGGCSNGTGCLPSSGLTASGNTFQSLSASPNNSFWIVDSTEVVGLVSRQNNYCTQLADATARFGVDGTVLTSLAAWQAATATDTQSRVLASTDTRCAAQAVPTAVNQPFVAAPPSTASYYTGTTRTTSDCTLAAVQTTYNQSSDRDVIKVKAGNCGWTGTLIVTKGVWIRGENACTVDANGRASACTTILTDNGTGFPSPFFKVTLGASQIVRISGIDYENGTRTESTFDGIVHCEGSNVDSRRLRVDHSIFNDLYQFAVFTDNCLGVQDHNYITRITVPVRSTVPVHYNRASNWNGTGAYGDASWADGDHFGTDQFWVIEDNTVLTPLGTALTYTDGDSGFRTTVRYNITTGGCAHWEGHGPEDGQRKRGIRAAEVYNNTMSCDGTSNIAGYYRGGAVLYHDNVTSGYGAAFWRMLLPRAADSFTSDGFSGVTGHNPWDNNVGSVAESGTSTSASGLTVTDSTKSWTVGQWIGYTVNRAGGTGVVTCTMTSTTATITATCANSFSAEQIVGVDGANEWGYNGAWKVATASGTGFTLSRGNGTAVALTTPATGTIHVMLGQTFGDITANTDKVLTVRGSIYGSTYQLAFPAGGGGTYTIEKATDSFDGAGMGQGDLLSGTNPGTPRWLNEARSPWYSWSNVREGGVHVNITPDSGQSVSGGHYFNDTAKPGYTAYAYPHPLIAQTGGN